VHHPYENAWIHLQFGPNRIKIVTTAPLDVRSLNPIVSNTPQIHMLIMKHKQMSASVRIICYKKLLRYLVQIFPQVLSSRASSIRVVLFNMVTVVSSHAFA